jgi:hypothetical protein
VEHIHYLTCASQNTPAPVGTSPTVQHAIVDGNKTSEANGTQQTKVLPVVRSYGCWNHLSTSLTSDSQNAPAPVGTSLPPPNAIVDTNKLNGNNVSQQPKGLPVVCSW